MMQKIYDFKEYKVATLFLNRVYLNYKVKYSQSQKGGEVSEKYFRYH